MTIRRTPQDFAVEEHLAPEWLPMPQRPAGAAHAVYLLEKVSLTTPQASAGLARALKVRSGQVSHAGLKDKHAVTRQSVSVPWTRGEPPPPTCGESGWSATFAGWLPRVLDAGAIARNSFTIVVRDLSPLAASEMHRRASSLRDGAALAVINYFGDQRFGSARHGEGFVARHLIRGEFEQALRLAIGTPHRKDSGARKALTRGLAAAWGEWPRLAADLPRCPERAAIETLAQGGSFADAFAALPYPFQQLCVEAFQSHLWNAIARELVDGVTDAAGASPLLADDPFGELRFPPAGLISAAWRDATLPMLGPASVLDGGVRDAAMRVLEREGLTLDALRIPGYRRPVFREFSRSLIVAASGFDLSPPRSDELSRPGRVAVRARFDLPRGAYATVVLRALGQ